MRPAIDWHELSRRAAPCGLVLVLASWAWGFQRGAARPAPDLYPFLARAWPGASYRPLPGNAAFAVERDGRLLGHAAAATASGYSAPLTVAVGTGPDGRIASAALLEYADTPALMTGAPAFLRSLIGKRPEDAFEVGRDVDAVTGATYSSRGLAQAAAVAARAPDERGAGGTRAAGAIAFGAPETCLLLLLVAGTVGRSRSSLTPRARRWLRAGALLGSLVTIGFLWNRPWTIGFPARLLAGDWPSWRSHLYWYLLFASLLFAFGRSGRSAYCPWICPFGAAQDVIGRIGGARRRRVPARLLFTWVKCVLLCLAVTLGLVCRDPGAASYEVFAAFFRLTGSGFQFAILALVLVTAAFVARPFCHWVCPVDPTEQLARVARRRVLALAGFSRATPRRPRPLFLPVLNQPGPQVPVFRRLRDALLTAVGLVCALLVLGHLHERLGGPSRRSPENLLSTTFVAARP